MSALPKRCFTPEEYLALEEKAEYKSQYVAGEIFAMAGAQPSRVIIQTNLAGELRNRFRGRECYVFSSDLRVKTPEGDLYTYPDLSTVCGKPEFDAAKPPSLLNPQVIFEVLSPSTEAFDRGDKFARYRRLESLTDYVLVASEQVRVEHYVRQGSDAWILTEYRQLSDRAPLQSVGCELPLEEIYHRVTFSDARREA